MSHVQAVTATKLFKSLKQARLIFSRSKLFFLEFTYKKVNNHGVGPHFLGACKKLTCLLKLKQGSNYIC